MMQILTRVLAGLFMNSASASEAPAPAKWHEQPLSLPKDFTEMVARMRASRGKFDMMPRPDQVQWECAVFSQLPQTYVCVFNYKILMNAALLRVSAFVEEKERILNNQEWASALAQDKTEGHDLISTDVERFQRAYLAKNSTFLPPEKTFDKGYLQVETDFREQFLTPKFIPSRNGVLLALAADTDTETTFSHELMHAQYFHSSRMRKTVHNFWIKNVTPQDRTQILKLLEKRYNTARSAVIENEFQAYLLMNHPDKALLKNFEDKYRNPLKIALAQAGLKPISEAMLP